MNIAIGRPMKLWIIILSLYLSAFRADACTFRKDLKKVYSLSGPVTMALKEIGLLKDPKLKAISVFHPISTGEFTGEFLPGGVFLSRENAHEMLGSHVFYDDSRELERVLNSLNVTVIVIKTRGIVPTEVTKQTGEILKKYTSGCEGRIRSFQQKAERAAEEVLKKLPSGFKAVFFIGNFRGNRAPEMIMVNDGIVKWLKEKGKLETYPTELSYLAWSAKVLNSLPADTLKIGVIDSGGRLARQIDRPGPKTINFTYPGSLVPGLSQLEAWIYLCSNLK